MQSTLFIVLPHLMTDEGGRSLFIIPVKISLTNISEHMKSFPEHVSSRDSQVKGWRLQIHKKNEPVCG